MVSRLAAAISVEGFALGTENKHSALLPGIALEALLAKPFFKRPEPAAGSFERERGADAAFELGFGVGFAFRVGQEGEIEVLLVAKIRRLVRTSTAHHHQLCPLVANLFHRAAQLRDLLTAEQSPEMADEDENGGTFLPEATKADRLIVRGADFEEGEMGSEVGSWGHRRLLVDR